MVLCVQKPEQMVMLLIAWGERLIFREEAPQSNVSCQCVVVCGLSAIIAGANSGLPPRAAEELCHVCHINMAMSCEDFKVVYFNLGRLLQQGS